MKPKGSKTKEGTQISTYASAVTSENTALSLGKIVLILYDKYSWPIPAATQPRVWSVNQVG
jgi:hypothetical protein